MMPENLRIIRTKAQWEAKFREENPVIVRAVNEIIETLSEKDYEAMILQWTQSAFDNQQKTIADEEKTIAEKAALLVKLGITEDEAKLLLS